MSSLIDLKAELSRKEEEFGKLRTNENKSKTETRNKTFQKLQDITKKKKKKKKTVGDWHESDEEEHSTKTISDETKEIYAKAQQKLIAKAKIYEKMQRGDMEDVEDYKGETRYLVDFDKKYYVDSGGGSSSSVLIDNEVEKEEERRKYVAENIYEADLDYRDKLHEKWQKEQDDILNGPVHYENVKFDEVRNLGTGYYAFSKDAEERSKQMDDMKKMREETTKIHQKKDILQKKRKAALDARLLKVKRRKAEEEGRLDEFLKEMAEEEKKKELAETAGADKDSSSTLSGHDGGDENTATKNTEISMTEMLLKECRNESSKPAREWDQGKHENSTLGSQAFVKAGQRQPKQHQEFSGQYSNKNNTTASSFSSYEKKLENLRKDRPDEFAPPSLY